MYFWMGTRGAYLNDEKGPAKKAGVEKDWGERR